MTSLSNATLWAYAFTAASGLSLVESSWTASRASSRALVKARRDEGLCSERCECSEGGASRVLSGCPKPSEVRSGARKDEGGRYDWGGGSERSSIDEDIEESVFCAADDEAWRNWEKAATADRFGDAEGLAKELEREPREIEFEPDGYIVLSDDSGIGGWLRALA